MSNKRSFSRTMDFVGVLAAYSLFNLTRNSSRQKGGTLLLFGQTKAPAQSSVLQASVCGLQSAVFFRPAVFSAANRIKTGSLSSDIPGKSV